MLAFADLLTLAGVEGTRVRLLRHQAHAGPGYPTPYSLWRDSPDRFDDYQADQSIGNRAKLNAPIWASFVAVGATETLFVGLYDAELEGSITKHGVHPLTGEPDNDWTGNRYRIRRQQTLQDYIGRLWIDWGSGYRAWIQRGDGTPKPVTELRRQFSEPPFPGFTALIIYLSQLDGLPRAWSATLSYTRGIYLLTCPRTGEQYVGMASGEGGFLARWREYAATGHGGNVGLKCREPSDYRLAVLETVGSSATEADLLKLEELWKRKLQSRELGLNRN